MKKRKISLWLNIVTICLSVCAIAIGVYSLKKSSLNVKGTVGFVAHNVRATVSAQIKGDAVNGTTSSSGGTPRADYATIGNTVTIDGTESTISPLDLSDFYFSDLGGSSGVPADIYLKISVTNNSDYAIKAYFTSPSIEGVTISLGEDSSSYVKLGTTTDTKTGDIVLKLSLNANESGDYDNLSAANNINLTMNLEKYEDYYVKEVAESVYNSTKKAFEEVITNRLCTQLGHGTKEDLNGAEFELLEWYAFAVRGEGSSYSKPSFVPTGSKSITTGLNEIWYSLYGVDMTNVDYKGYTFWFIQQYTVGGGDAKDTNGTCTTGKKFKSSPSSLAVNPYINGTDQSDIFKYLNGNSENSCDTRKSTYQIDTGIDKDLYYKSILKASARTVNETYTTKITIPTSTEAKVNTNFTSNFWLLNYAELGLAYNQDLAHSDTNKNIAYVFSIGQKNGLTSTSGTVYGANWWLRSPDATACSGAQYVCSKSIITQLMSYSSVGVRAAFQITL